MEHDYEDEQARVDADNGRKWREFHTSGPNCHWCYGRPAAYVWCPWGTHVCDYCHDLTMEGREDEVVEILAASMTVHGSFGRGVGRIINPESFRDHHRDTIREWIENRTHAHKVTGDQVHDPRFVETFNDD